MGVPFILKDLQSLALIQFPGSQFSFTKLRIILSLWDSLPRSQNVNELRACDLSIVYIFNILEA